MGPEFLLLFSRYEAKKEEFQVELVLKVGSITIPSEWLSLGAIERCTCA